MACLLSLIVSERVLAGSPNPVTALKKPCNVGNEDGLSAQPSISLRVSLYDLSKL